MAETELNTNRPPVDTLVPALQRLDLLLEQAMATARTVHGLEAATDFYRGLHISRAEVERLLAHEPGRPLFQSEDKASEQPLPEPIVKGSRLAWLQQAFGLTLFDLDLILIALAPELDRRYERLYAFLQDHVSRRWPTVDLALHLLCHDAMDRLERRSHFDPDATLIRSGLLHLHPDPTHPHPSLLAHSFQLDQQVTRFLLHQDSLDTRLSACCEVLFTRHALQDLPLDDNLKQGLSTLIQQAHGGGDPLRLYFEGPEGVGKRQTALALAAEADTLLLVLDLPKALAAPTPFLHLLQLAYRYAWFYDLIPYFHGLDWLQPAEQRSHYRQLMETISRTSGLTILAGTRPLIPSPDHPLSLITVPFNRPNPEQRHAYWKADLATAGLTLNGTDLTTLAGRFRLTPAQISQAVVTARYRAQWRASEENGSPPALTIDDLFSAARDQSGHDLDRLTQKIYPLYIWEDIVLPADALAQLREICQRVNHRHQVLHGWGFARKLSLGQGTTALFAGPSGTGKTMAAEIIARELGLDLYKIDLSGVVSKYIGETEKNLNRIFRAAENANAILFFDEADALFGKRSEVRDSHDRYANIEISYLLQKMESYQGLAILATNLRQNLDDAFIRRLAFTVHFPFPDEASRRRIWAGIWPPQMPLADSIEPALMAKQFKLSGGNIKNIALAAAFLAAEDGGVVSLAHLGQAIRREYQKMGKVLSETEFNGFGRDLQPVELAKE